VFPRRQARDAHLQGGDLRPGSRDRAHARFRQRHPAR
jgi:hypothetical protein